MSLRGKLIKLSLKGDFSRVKDIFLQRKQVSNKSPKILVSIHCFGSEAHLEFKMSNVEMTPGVT